VAEHRPPRASSVLALVFAFLADRGFFGTSEILPFAASAGLLLMSYTGIVVSPFSDDRSASLYAL
jgi:hypothetical protein